MKHHHNTVLGVYMCEYHITFCSLVLFIVDWIETKQTLKRQTIFQQRITMLFEWKKSCSAESSNENENWCNLGISPHCRSLSVTLLSIIIKRFQSFNSRWFLICNSSCPSLGFMSGRYDAYHYTNERLQFSHFYFNQIESFFVVVVVALYVY